VLAIHGGNDEHVAHPTSALTVELSQPQHNVRSQRPFRSERSLGWCERGFHVDFMDDEQVPLKQGRFLGPGVQGTITIH
jgi:hypothetical protein